MYSECIITENFASRFSKCTNVGINILNFVTQLYFSYSEKDTCLLMF